MIERENERVAASPVSDSRTMFKTQRGNRLPRQIAIEGHHLFDAAVLSWNRRHILCEGKRINRRRRYFHWHESFCHRTGDVNTNTVMANASERQILDFHLRGILDFGDVGRCG